jgi:hypothetical protein
MACHFGNRPILFSGDNGWTSIKDYPELVDKVTVDEIQNITHFKLWTDAVINQTPKYREFDHYIIDPMNVVINLYTHDYLQRAFTTSKQGENRTDFTPTRLGTEAGETSFTTAGLSDYNATLTFIRPIVFKLCRLPKNVTFICHAKEPGVTESKTTTPMRASLPKEVYALFAQFVDYIGYVEADKGRYTISFDPSAKEDAGSRIRSLHGKKIQTSEFADRLNKWQAGEQ